MGIQSAELCIFMVTYNKVAEAREIIERIYKYTEPGFRLVVVDNNSQGGMSDYLYGLCREKGNVTLVMNRQNRYACPATNQALKLAREKYAVYLCSRECFIFDYGWENDCVAYMDDNPDVGIAGHLVQSPDYDTYESLTRLDTFPLFRNKGYAMESPGRRCMHVQGGFYIIRMSMAREIGLFNEAIVQDHMDVEYSYYAESMGWKLGDIPYVCSISIKTRPAIEGYTDGVKIYHPLTIEKAAEFDRVKRSTTGGAG